MTAGTRTAAASLWSRLRWTCRRRNRPVEGKPVYQVRAGDSEFMVAETELAGPLRELVMAVLAADGG